MSLQSVACEVDVAAQIIIGIQLRDYRLTEPSFN